MSAVLQVTSMTTKGQVVIPSGIRTELGIDTGSKFVVISDGQNILLKPIERPKMEIFRDLQKKSQKIIKSSGFKKSDLPELIKKVRRESRT